jgi:hypothetical protein
MPLTCRGFFAAALAIFTLAPGPVRAADAPAAAAKPWQVGDPIVTYWAGPAMSDAVAKQMADGGFNVVWCTEKDLDLVQRYGLRGMLQDPLLVPGTVESPEGRGKLDALAARVKGHPAMHSYFVTDEPSAAAFPALGKLVAYLRDRDPAHVAYVNLFPTYASNEQLGTKGDVATAYREHLRQYVDVVRPALISYDHYQFYEKRESDQYFLNLSMVRTAARDAGIPFLNIVQAAAWAPDVRVPTADETRYLVYTTLAYGARGISYYVYYADGHRGGIADKDGKPTPIYDALKTLNREFVAIGRELTPLESLAVYHTALRKPGCDPLPADAPFRAATPAPAKPDDKPRGVLLGYFGERPDKPTAVLVVNVDHKSPATVALTAPAPVDTFDPSTAKWTPANTAKLDLTLPPGGGRLVRLSR